MKVDPVRMRNNTGKMYSYEFNYHILDEVEVEMQWVPQ